jgi:hypothetical protein
MSRPAIAAFGIWLLLAWASRLPIVSNDGTYLHGFGRDGEFIGQNGPYPPDESAAIDQGRRALRRLGARRVVSIDAATPAAAFAQAEQVLREPGTGVPPEPWSAADRIGRVLALVGAAVGLRVARYRSRRFRDRT